MHRGRLPSANKIGHSPTAEWTEVPDRPYDGPSPDLPKLGRGHKWAEPVVGWWEVVRRMPHCVLWTPTDWQYAVETAYLKQAFWIDYMGGDVKSTMATEIRRREDNMGTTLEARRKLRIRYGPDGEQGLDDAAPGAGTVTNLRARRQRLAG